MEPARAFAGVLSHRLWLCLRTGKRKNILRSLVWLLLVTALPVIVNPLVNHRGNTPVLLYQRSADYSRGCSLRPVHRADDRRHAVLVSGLFQEPGQRRLSLFIRRKTALHRSDGNDDLPVCTPVSPKPSGDRSGAENFGSRRQPGDDKAKASSRGRPLSALVSITLEDSLQTADSMNARGYGLPGKTRSRKIRFALRDGVLLAASLGELVCFLLLLGWGSLIFTIFRRWPARNGRRQWRRFFWQLVFTF